MPRQSAASLSVVPAWEPKASARPVPPDHLNQAAAAIWREVTESRPGDYFDAASLGLLEAYARALAEHRRVMDAVEAMDPANDAAAFCKLTRIADAHAARVSQLATRMRLSQQSRTDSRGAGRAAGDHRTPEERQRANYGSGA